MEKNKIIRDAKFENTKAKREKRMLKCKVSKILGERLPSIKNIPANKGPSKVIVYLTFENKINNI